MLYLVSETENRIEIFTTETETEFISKVIDYAKERSLFYSREELHIDNGNPIYKITIGKTEGLSEYVTKLRAYYQALENLKAIEGDD